MKRTCSRRWRCFGRHIVDVVRDWDGRGQGAFRKHVQSRDQNKLSPLKKSEGTVFPVNMASCLRLVSTNLHISSVLISRLGTRNIHRRIPLPYPIADGLGKFLPPAALRTLVEYQDGLLSRLNEEVRGSSTNLTIIGIYDIIPLYTADSKQENHSSIVDTAIKYAKQRKRTLAFNYAVLALNNSFFLNQLVCIC